MDAPTPGAPVMDRRRFLRSAGGAATSLATAVTLGAATAACSGASPPPPRRAPPRPAPVGPAPWPELARSLQGRVVVPSDSTYPGAVLLYDERFDGAHPAAIAYCAGPVDVQRSIEFARRFEVPVSVRSGGHSFGGYSVGPGLVLDVTPMADVVPGPGRARVGAGARLVDMYASLAQAGLVVPGGSCPTVGIAGLALGGGIGVLGRAYGLTCDNVSSLQLVSADSRVLTCSPAENDDLYWACRGGGGGNFGVVTSFEFIAHLVPAVALFTLEWPWAAATETVGAWQQWIAGTPDELWTNCQLLSEGSSGTKLRVTGVFCGDVDELSAQLAPLQQAVGTPSYRFVGPVPFLEAMLVEAGCEDLTVSECHLSTEDPAGRLTRSAFVAKSVLVDDPLPTGAAAGIVDALDHFQQTVAGMGAAVVFDAYGGAINRVAPDATAFVHRQALADIELSVNWSAASSRAVEAATGWLASTAAALAPYGSGAYQNYIDPSLDGWQDAYYRSNLPRLRRTKRAIDPDDIFHFAQSIPL